MLFDVKVLWRVVGHAHFSSSNIRVAKKILKIFVNQHFARASIRDVKIPQNSEYYMRALRYTYLLMLNCFGLLLVMLILALAIFEA